MYWYILICESHYFIIYVSIYEINYSIYIYLLIMSILNRRDKIMNYFQVMYEKKFRKDGDEGEEEETGKKGAFKKS